MNRRVTTRRQTRATGRQTRVTRTAQFTRQAMRKRVHPLFLILGASALFLAVFLICFLWDDGPDPTIAFADRMKEARAAEAAERWDDALRLGREALALTEGMEEADAQKCAREARAFLLDVEMQQKKHEEAGKIVADLVRETRELIAVEPKPGDLLAYRSRLNELLHRILRVKNQLAGSSLTSSIEECERKIRLRLDQCPLPPSWARYRRDVVDPFLEKHDLPQFSKAVDAIFRYVPKALSESDRASAKRYRTFLQTRARDDCRDRYGADPASFKTRNALRDLGSRAKAHFLSEKERYRGTRAEEMIDAILGSL